jgi:hypothetical protein
VPRVLAPAPATFVDPHTGAPAFGSYAGSLPAIAMPGLGAASRTFKRKRWVYVAIASDDVWIALGVVHTGYAATAFGFAYDLREKRMLHDATTLGTAFAASVADGAHASGVVARFASGRTTMTFERTKEGLAIAARLGDLEVDATVDDRGAPPAIAAVADLGGGLFDATEKRVLASVRGRMRSGGTEVSLDGATAGYDYTYGLLPRHTKWRWAFGLGRSNDGAAIAFNVVQGFVGEAECAAFTETGVHPIAEPTFTFDVDAPMSPWRLTGDGVDLAFTPGAVHAQRTNLGLVRSRFIQPVGTFSGTLRIDGKDVGVSSLAGVVEDQDVLW